MAESRVLIYPGITEPVVVPTVVVDTEAWDNPPPPVFHRRRFMGVGGPVDVHGFTIIPGVDLSAWEGRPGHSFTRPRFIPPDLGLVPYRAGFLTDPGPVRPTNITGPLLVYQAHAAPIFIEAITEIPLDAWESRASTSFSQPKFSQPQYAQPEYFLPIEVFTIDKWTSFSAFAGAEQHLTRILPGSTTADPFPLGSVQEAPFAPSVQPILFDRPRFITIGGAPDSRGFAILHAVDLSAWESIPGILYFARRQFFLPSTVTDWIVGVGVPFIPALDEWYFVPGMAFALPRFMPGGVVGDPFPLGPLVEVLLPDWISKAGEIFALPRFLPGYGVYPAGSEPPPLYIPGVGYALSAARMRRLRLLGVLDDGSQEASQRWRRKEGRPWWTRRPGGS